MAFRCKGNKWISFSLKIETHFDESINICYGLKENTDAMATSPTKAETVK